MWWTLAATCPPTGCRLGPRKNRVENGSAGRDSTRFVAAPRRWAAGSPPRDYAAGRSYGPGGRCVRAGPHGARHAARRLPGRQCLYRGDRHCGGPHGFPCGECRGGTTLDRVLYRQVHRSGQLVHWSRNSAFREGGLLCDISVDVVANKLKRPSTEAPAQALGRSGVGELSDQQSPWYRSN